MKINKKYTEEKLIRGRLRLATAMDRNAGPTSRLHTKTRSGILANRKSAIHTNGIGLGGF